MGKKFVKERILDELNTFPTIFVYVISCKQIAWMLAVSTNRLINVRSENRFVTVIDL